MAAPPVRLRLGRHRLARRVRGPRPQLPRADHLVRGVRAVRAARRAQLLRRRARPRRSHAHRAGQRRAEVRVPAADPEGRDAMVPGVLRARERVGPRLALDARGARRRHARRERPEGLDELRPPRRLPGAPRPHRPERPEAQGHHLGDLRHADPGDRRPADPDDRRRRPLLRDLLRRRPHPGRQRRRRDQQRLERGDVHARDRAGARRARLPARDAARHRRIDRPREGQGSAERRGAREPAGRGARGGRSPAIDDVPQRRGVDRRRPRAVRR